MIAKIGTGNRMSGLMAYLFGRGRSNEHTDPHLVAGDPVVMALAADLEPASRPEGGGPEDWASLRRHAAALAHDLDAPARLFADVVPARATGDRPPGHVWHCSLSIHPDEPALDDATWAAIAADVVAAMGFDTSMGKAACRWAAVRHGRSEGGNDHIHLVVNLIREDGTRASDWRSYKTVSRACAEAETRYGLRVVQGRPGGGMPGLTRAEIEKSARTGAAEPDRLRLAREVRAAAVASTDEAEFVRRLRAAGLLVRPRYATGDRHQVVGYSLAVRPGSPTDSRGMTPPPIWYGGGRLGSDLTLPRLRERWPHADAEAGAQARHQALAAWRRERAHERTHQDTTEPTAEAAGSTAGRESAVYPETAWDQAAAAVTAVRERLAAIPADQGGAWAGAAWEAAGVLACWSARVELRHPGPLAAAADALARAAQTTRGTPRAHRHQAIKDLRGVALVAAQARNPVLSAGNTGQVRLLRQLSRLMQAVHDIHRATGRTQTALALAAVARHQLAALHAAPGSSAPSNSPMPSAPPAMSPAMSPVMSPTPGIIPGRGQERGFSR